MKPQILSTPIAETKSRRASPVPMPARVCVESAALHSQPSTPNSPPRPPGRPSIFTDALVDKICDFIQNTGVSDSAAGLLAGVSTSTLSRWKAENPDFAILLEAARAELQRELITAVREARRRDGSSDWRGAAWLLERLFPEEFGRRPRSKAHPIDPEPSAAATQAPPLPVSPKPAPAHAVTAQPGATHQTSSSFPNPAPAEKTEPSFPNPILPETDTQTSSDPVSSENANLPEYLPTPRRFRCARITPGVAAYARASGHQPAEPLQLFPKTPFPPFPPNLNPDPSPSLLVPKPNPNRPTPLTGPIVPPVLTTVNPTVF